MVFEHATLPIASGREAAFEEAFHGVVEIFDRAGAHGVELRRCIETPSQYVLIVQWATLEDHMVRFRESPLFVEWRAAVSEFFAEPPIMAHYETC